MHGGVSSGVGGLTDTRGLSDAGGLLEWTGSEFTLSVGWRRGRRGLILHESY